MKDKLFTKKAYRADIRKIKASYTPQKLHKFSEDVMELLEQDPLFQSAHTIFIYHSMADEVNTHDLLNTYSDKKRFVLPVVCGDEIVLKTYFPETAMHFSSYGIWEPDGADFTDLNKIDLVIVPGIAFDRKLNRMGRGKGFYDRLLPKLKAPKIGICFDFQLFDEIPVEKNDIKMDKIISEFEMVL